MHDLISASIIRPWPTDKASQAAALLEGARQGFQHKIIVLDDDPTGVQTVHGVYVYTSWDQASIDEAFDRPEQLFFLLTNSRGMDEATSRQVHEDIATRVLHSARRTGKPFILISRSDSTLRGHYPMETDTLRACIEKDSDIRYDGEIISPFFLEGGRFTMDNIHYVKEGEQLRPAGQTEFGKDQTFGYQHSHLGEWVEEKTRGRYTAGGTCYIALSDLRALRVDHIREQLMQVQGFGKVILNATAYEDVAVFLTAYLQALQAGKQFMFRSAAAVPKVLGGIATKPLLTGKDMGVPAGQPGLVLVGSHVRKTTQQLEALLAGRPDIAAHEFSVAAALNPNSLQAETERIRQLVEADLRAGRHGLVYTSRQLVKVEGSGEQSLRLSISVSEALTAMVASLQARPGFIIAKGGITSSDIGVKALAVRRALVWGQILPGVPVWQTGEHSKYPGIPYIIFPGNVGGEDALLEAFNKLAGGGPSKP